MKISVFGLGYVGTVSAACFAQQGHHVVGVDINPTKIEIINNGRSPVIEREIDEIISAAAPGGGFIFSSSNSLFPPMEPEIITEAYHYVKKAGKYI